MGLTKDQWEYLSRDMKSLMRDTRRLALMEKRYRISQGASPNAPECKRLDTVVTRTLQISQCNKKKSEHGWTCRNAHFCDYCGRKKRHAIARTVGKFLTKARKKTLYAYTRKEDFLIPVEELDWDKIRNEYIPFLSHRRNRLYKTLSQGCAGCIGATQKIEVINNSYYRGYVSVRLTSLLVFNEKRIYSMSPYWTQKIVYEENADGVPIHKATLEYAGSIDNESSAFHRLNQVFPSRLYTYNMMGAEMVKNIIIALNGTLTWLNYGPVFRESVKNTHKKQRSKNARRDEIPGESLYL